MKIERFMSDLLVVEPGGQNATYPYVSANYYVVEVGVVSYGLVAGTWSTQFFPSLYDDTRAFVAYCNSDRRPAKYRVMLLAALLGSKDQAGPNGVRDREAPEVGEPLPMRRLEAHERISDVIAKDLEAL